MFKLEILESMKLNDILYSGTIIIFSIYGCRSGDKVDYELKNFERTDELILYLPNNSTEVHIISDHNGKLSNVHTEVNGKVHGVSISIMDGVIGSTGEWQESKMNGDWYIYHPNGEVMKHRVYVDNKLHGYVSSYDTLGYLIEKLEYNNGEYIRKVK